MPHDQKNCDKSNSQACSELSSVLWNLKWDIILWRALPQVCFIPCAVSHMNCLKMYGCLLFLILCRARVTLRRFLCPGVLGLGRQTSLLAEACLEKQTSYIRTVEAVYEKHTDKSTFSNCVSRSQRNTSTS